MKIFIIILTVIVIALGLGIVFYGPGEDLTQDLEVLSENSTQNGEMDTQGNDNAMGEYKLVSQTEDDPASKLIYLDVRGTEKIIEEDIYTNNLAIKPVPDSVGAWNNVLYILEGIKTENKIAFREVLEPYHGSSGPLYVYDLDQKELRPVEGTEDLVLDTGWGWPSPDGTKAIAPDYERGKEVLRVFDIISGKVAVFAPDFEEGFGMFANDGVGISVDLKWVDPRTIEYGLFQDQPSKTWRKLVGTREISL